MCAVIKRGILGGFQNKIANVVGSSWKGIATMRSLPISVANPRTAPQVTQRNKFSLVSKFASDLLTTVIKPLWDRFAQQESGYNAFVRVNIDNFNGTELINDVGVEIARGTLAVSEITDVIIDQGAGTIVCTFDATPAGDALGTDQAYIAVYNNDTLEVQGWANVGIRSAGTFTVGAVEGFTAGNGFILWLAFRRADGSKVSNTTYFNGSVVA